MNRPLNKPKRLTKSKSVPTKSKSRQRKPRKFTPGSAQQYAALESFGAKMWSATHGGRPLDYYTPQRRLLEAWRGQLFCEANHCPEVFRAEVNALTLELVGDALRRDDHAWFAELAKAMRRYPNDPPRNPDKPRLFYTFYSRANPARPLRQLAKAYVEREGLPDAHIESYRKLFSTWRELDRKAEKRRQAAVDGLASKSGATNRRNIGNT